MSFQTKGPTTRLSSFCLHKGDISSNEEENWMKKRLETKKVSLVPSGMWVIFCPTSFFGNFLSSSFSSLSPLMSVFSRTCLHRFLSLFLHFFLFFKFQHFSIPTVLSKSVATWTNVSALNSLDLLGCEASWLYVYKQPILLWAEMDNLFSFLLALFLLSPTLSRFLSLSSKFDLLWSRFLLFCWRQNIKKSHESQQLTFFWMETLLMK